MPEQIFSRALDLAECVCEALNDTAREDGGEVNDKDQPYFKNCCVWVGPNVPWDNCCEDGGTAFVTILSGAPKFAENGSQPGCFSGTHDVTFEIVATRCIGLNDKCDCTCKERGARRVLGDLEAIIKAVACCFGEDGDSNCETPKVSSWEALRSGGCGGVKVRVTVANEFATCCTTEEN